MARAPNRFVSEKVIFVRYVNRAKYSAHG